MGLPAIPALSKSRRQHRADIDLIAAAHMEQHHRACAKPNGPFYQH
jgi:hypothetical protein